jgi:hypothetical protein
MYTACLALFLLRLCGQQERITTDGFLGGFMSFESHVGTYDVLLLDLCRTFNIPVPVALFAGTPDPR